MHTREQIINNYLTAYNNFDVEGMVHDLDETVKFENVTNGEVNMTLNGLAAFKEQAIQIIPIFETRRQTANSFTHNGDQTEVLISYYAVVAMDLPNGLTKGTELNLTGTSIFTFAGDKITAITDIS